MNKKDMFYIIIKYDVYILIFSNFKIDFVKMKVDWYDNLFGNYIIFNFIGKVY